MSLHLPLHYRALALLTSASLASTVCDMFVILTISNGYSELAILALDRSHVTVLQVIIHECPLTLEVSTVLALHLEILIDNYILFHETRTHVVLRCTSE